MKNSDSHTSPALPRYPVSAAPFAVRWGGQFCRCRSWRSGSSVRPSAGSSRSAPARADLPAGLGAAAAVSDPEGGAGAAPRGSDRGTVSQRPPSVSPSGDSIPLSHGSRYPRKDGGGTVSEASRFSCCPARVLACFRVFRSVWDSFHGLGTVSGGTPFNTTPVFYPSRGCGSVSLCPQLVKYGYI